MWLSSASSAFRDERWPGLEAAQRERIERFGADVLRYNRAQNLISRRDPERQLAQLVEECVAAGTAIGERGYGGRAWSDAGSGAGFPGMILACLDPEQPITLLERRQGRCDFLRREAAGLDLHAVRIHEGDLRDHARESFDLVLAKALAPPGKVEALCGPLVSGVGTLLVFGRGGDVPAPGWRVCWSTPLPGHDSVLRALARGPA